MTWSISGMVITQSGTDENLAGLATLTGSGVTATTAGDVTTYHVTEARQIVVTGTLNVDPFTEVLFIGSHPDSPTPSFRVNHNDAVLNINGYRSHSGDEGNIFDRNYTGNIWLHVLKESPGNFNAAEQAFVFDNGRINWQGGAMRLAGGFYIGNGSLYAIQAQLILEHTSARDYYLLSHFGTLTILSLDINGTFLTFRAPPADSPFTQIRVHAPARQAFLGRGASGGGGTSDPIRFANSDINNVPVHFAASHGAQVVAVNPPFDPDFGKIHGVVERVGNVTEYHSALGRREGDLRGLVRFPDDADGNLFAVGYENNALFRASVDSDGELTGEFEKVSIVSGANMGTVPDNFGTIALMNPTAICSYRADSNYTSDEALIAATRNGLKGLFRYRWRTGEAFHVRFGTNPLLTGVPDGGNATILGLLRLGANANFYAVFSSGVYELLRTGHLVNGRMVRVAFDFVSIGRRGSNITGCGVIQENGVDVPVIYDNEDGVLILGTNSEGTALDPTKPIKVVGPTVSSAGSGAVRGLAGRGVATYRGRHYGLSGAGDYLFRHLRRSKVSFGLFQGVLTGGSAIHQSHFFARRTIDMDVRDVHGNGIQGAKIYCRQERETGLVPSANVPPSDAEGDFLDFEFPIADFIKTSNTYIDGAFPKEWLNYYGQDGLDGVDIGVCHYRYDISHQRYALLEHNYIADLNVHLPVDRSLTERSSTTINAYTTLETAAKAYDALKVYVWDNYAGESRPPALREADTLDFGAANVNLRVSGTPVVEKATAMDGTVTWTLTTGEQFRGSLVTTGTVEAPAVDVVGYINHTTGRRGVLALTAHGGETVAVFEPDGDRIDKQLLPGMASTQILVESTSLHSDDAVIPGMRVIVNRAGYHSEKRSLDFDTGALQRELFERLEQAYLPTGATMYGDGMVSAGSPVAVVFDNSDLSNVFARIDIGDAIVPVHDLYVAFELACLTDDGLKYLAFGGRKITINLDPIAGDSVALPSGVKLRREAAGDTNAGVLGVAYHPDNLPVDDVNGGVRIVGGFNSADLESALETAFRADVAGTEVQTAGSIIGILQRLRAIVATIAGNTQPPP